MSFATEYDYCEADQLRAEVSDFDLIDSEEPSELERLHDAANELQQWMFALRLAITNKKPVQAWQALAEIEASVQTILEDHP